MTPYGTFTERIARSALFLTVLIALAVSSRMVQGQADLQYSGWKGANNVTSEWMWGSGASRDYEATERDIIDAENAGIRWNRYGVYTPPDTRSYSEMDRLIALQRQHGINILMFLQQLSDHYAYNDTTARMKYKTWLSGIVNRYKADVHFYEIHNEENGTGDWKDYKGVEPVPARGDCNTSGFNTSLYNAGVHSYVMFLQDSYNAIKAADPTAKVIIGGISEWTMECFVDRLGAEQAYQWMDFMTFHPYADNPDASILRLNAMQTRIASWPAPYNRMGIWITEIGYHHQKHWSPPGYVKDAKVEAQYLVDEMNDLHLNGITAPIFWYILHEDGSSLKKVSSYLVGFGLTVRSSTDPGFDDYQPAYYAYKSMSDPVSLPYELLSQRKPCVASSVDGQGFEAAKAFDGNMTQTRWQSATGVGPQWLQVDLGTERMINRIKLIWGDGYAIDYRLELADDGSGPWTSIYATTTGTGGTSDIKNLLGRGRYVRMTGSRSGASSWYAILEMQVYGR